METRLDAGNRAAEDGAMARRLLRAFSAVLVVLALFVARAPLPCQGGANGQACSATACACLASCTCHAAHAAERDSAPDLWCHPQAAPAPELSTGAEKPQHVALAPIRFFALPAAWPALGLRPGEPAPLPRTPYAARGASALADPLEDVPRAA